MKCIGQTADGKPCDANAMKGHKYCYFHSPKVPDVDRKDGQSRGGKANLAKVDSPLPALPLKGSQDVVALLEETINLVRAGEMDVKVANCIGVLSGQLIKAIEVSSIANRVEVIERAILERRTRY